MLVGNTARLYAELKNFADVYADVDNIVVKIYDQNMTVLTTAAPTRLDTGKYYYYRVLTADDYAAEMSGTIDGNPIMVREGLSVSERL